MRQLERVIFVAVASSDIGNIEGIHNRLSQCPGFVMLVRV